MKRFSIRYQILLIALIPVLLIDSFLTFFHINSNIDQAKTLLRSNGTIVAEQIAGAAEFNLLAGNYSRIQSLIEQNINNNDIVYVSVYNDADEVIAQARSEFFSEQTVNQYLFHRQLIFTQTLGSTDIFEPDDYVEEAEIKKLGRVHLYISRQQLNEQILQIIIEGLILFIAMLIVALILTLIVSQRITRPIFKLQKHLKSIEKGQLGELIQDVESNEIGEVQKGFNSMSVSLLANRMELNEKIETATSQLKNAVINLEDKNRELAIARDHAQNADRIKSQFLANISHEIRTPINGIKGFINLLSHSGLQPEQKRYASIIKQSTQDLGRIINEVLDLAKIESGKIELHHTEFDLYELLESTRDGLFTVAMEKDIDLYLIIYSDTPRKVIGDASRIKQVLINLIGNAIKFTDDGHVSIKVYQDQIEDNRITINFEIEDSGIGISKEDQKSLFEAFNQIESDNNRRFSGTGLGLTIAKNLAIIMGGNILVKSQYGSGSLFKLYIPLQAVMQESSRKNAFIDQTAMIYCFDTLAQQELQSLFSRIGFDTQSTLITPNTDISYLKEDISNNIPLYQLLVIDLRHAFVNPRDMISQKTRDNARVKLLHYDPAFVEPELLNDFAFISAINTSKNLRLILEGQQQLATEVHSNSDVRPRVKSQKVLIVDDNRINLTLAQELVQLWGHQAFAAIDAEEALNLFDEESFDLILLDIQMPKIDGVQLMNIMREKNPGLEAPIVAITANVMELEKQRLLTAGFDAYLGKPIDEEKLRQLLEGKRNHFDTEDLYADTDTEKALSIDHELTLKLSAHNEQLANDVYMMLASELPDYLHSLKRSIAGHNKEALSLIIHKLEGVTCYVGLPRLKQLIYAYKSTHKKKSENSVGQAQAIRQELKIIRKEIDGFLNTQNSA
ncbi:MAG: ATP-binding protein [Gammaproteobacteria bacterium]|nr:ATP-binding protein [Gammaproteobacteria bacterium]